MRPRVVHGDGDAATTATWHGWCRPVRHRVDHGGGTRLVHDGVVEQRGVPGRLRTMASVHQLTGVADVEWSVQQWTQPQCSGHTALSNVSTDQTYGRPFTVTTDVKLAENARVSTVFSANFASCACQPAK